MRPDLLTQKMNTNEAILSIGSKLKDDIRTLRDIRAKYQIKNPEKIEFRADASTDILYLNAFFIDKINAEEIRKLLEKQVNGIYTQQRIYEAGKTPNGMSELIKKELTVRSSESVFHLFFDKVIDTTDQREKLMKDLEHQKNFLQSVQKKLSNERFVQNAKPEVVELERKNQADAEARIKTLEESLQNLN